MPIINKEPGNHPNNKIPATADKPSGIPEDIASRFFMVFQCVSIVDRSEKTGKERKLEKDRVVIGVVETGISSKKRQVFLKYSPIALF